MVHHPVIWAVHLIFVRKDVDSNMMKLLVQPDPSVNYFSFFQRVKGKTVGIEARNTQHCALHRGEKNESYPSWKRKAQTYEKYVVGLTLLCTAFALCVLLLYFKNVDLHDEILMHNYTVHGNTSYTLSNVKER